MQEYYEHKYANDNRVDYQSFVRSVLLNEI